MLHFENVRLGGSWMVVHWVPVTHWSFSPTFIYMYELFFFFFSCFTAYEQALQLATSEIQKSQILAALAMVAYQMGDVDNAKTLLFQR